MIQHLPGRSLNTPHLILWLWTPPVPSQKPRRLLQRVTGCLGQGATVWGCDRERAASSGYLLFSPCFWGVSGYSTQFIESLDCCLLCVTSLSIPSSSCVLFPTGYIHLFTHLFAVMLMPNPWHAVPTVHRGSTLTVERSCCISWPVAVGFLFLESELQESRALAAVITLCPSCVLAPCAEILEALLIRVSLYIF